MTQLMKKGLGMAGLNFVGNADYKEVIDGKDNITQFEFIPYILGKCASVKEARELLGKINITNIPFNEKNDFGTVTLDNRR